MISSSRQRRRVGVAVAATAAFVGALAGPLAGGAHADTFFGTFTFEPRTSIGSLATKAVFPAPGPASVSVDVGSGFGGQWNTFNKLDNGFGGFMLKNRKAGLCLDTANGGLSTAVAVRACDGTISQNWAIDPVPGTSLKYFTIRNGLSGKALTTLTGSSTPNLQSFSAGNTKQHWSRTVIFKP
ncbi:RICIN domain-containing protein [Streptomyces sp. R11]|uniref:RICIN domain-containing protein n=1 Tax=Streptomyces sp. R11 TaxID=3238625 RepID=A0AB39NDF2_9ACTN